MSSIPRELGAGESAPRLSRAALRRLLGWPPHRPAPLDGTVDEVVTLPGLRRERVSYAVADGERVAAYLFVPDRPLPGRPGVLCLHQHNGEYELGKSEPAGLAGNPEQAYALELAQRGFVTLAADALCFEERRDERLPGRALETFEMMRRLTIGSCLQAKYSWDACRGLDYLASRVETNPRRLGCIGHSLGGQQALYLAALDRRVRASVSSCGFATLATIFRDAINHNLAAYVPGLGQTADVGDVLALAAPRAFLALAGRADRIFPIDGVEAAVARARGAYDTASTRDRLALEIAPGGHGFAGEQRERAYAWLERWLSGMSAVSGSSEPRPRR